MVFFDALTLRTRERIARFGLDQRMPVVSGWAQFAESGCLMTYGPNLPASFRRLATYVDRILKGARAAELPVELPTIVELVVNLKTAKALGLAIPPAVLARHRARSPNRRSRAWPRHRGDCLTREHRTPMQARNRVRTHAWPPRLGFYWTESSTTTGISRSVLR